MNRTLLRKCLMVGARVTGLSALSARLFGGVGAVFMLHRIGPPQNPSGLNAFLSCAPDFLDRLLGSLRRDGWRFVSLDEVADRLAAGHGDERFAAVTLDDGYRDNAERGAPVFRAHDVPYAIFVCPGLVDGRAFVWWEVLARAIDRNDRVTLATDDAPIMLDCATPARKRAAYRRLLDHLSTAVDEDAQRRFVARFAADHGVDPAGHCRDAIMGWDALRALGADPLCTIGAHTIHHVNLKRLDRHRALDEIAGSIEELAARLGERPRHFAYPYGGPAAAGAREVELARKAGLTTAVTTRHGLLQPGHAGHLLALPRISLNGEYQRAHYVDTMLSGATVALANRGRRLVTV